MRLWVRSLALLSGLRIWHCGGLWCRLQMWLRSGMAVAVPVVWAGSCRSNWTPSLGNSICCGSDPRKDQKKKKKRNISFQIKVLQKEEHIWSGIQASEAHCKHLVPTEHLAVSSSISLVRRDAYVGKKRRADFLADHHWVWCFFTE